MRPEPKYRVGQFVIAKVVPSELSIMDLDCEVVDYKWNGDYWEYRVTLIDAIFGDVVNMSLTIKESELEIE